MAMRQSAKSLVLISLKSVAILAASFSSVLTTKPMLGLYGCSFSNRSQDTLSEDLNGRLNVGRSESSIILVFAPEKKAILSPT